jgi:hypothetical protein
MIQHSKGFVYVATGSKFLAEAESSVRTLRMWNPDAKVSLITDRPYTSTIFDSIIVTTERNLHPYQFKLNMIEAPYDFCVFLDSDTEVLSDISELFCLLNQFDIAISKDYFAKGISDYSSDIENSILPEWNTGVIAFRRSDEMCDFFNTCAENYAKLYIEEGFVRGQRSFLQTLYYSRLRIIEFPNTYNFMPYEATLIPSDVKILHGRRKDFLRNFLSPTLLQDNNPRIYIPHFGTISNRGRYIHGLERQVFFLRSSILFLSAAIRYLVQQDLIIMISSMIDLMRVRLGALRRKISLRKIQSSIKD